MSITWCNSVQLNSQLSGRASTRTILVSESEEDQLIDHTLLEGEEDVSFFSLEFCWYGSVMFVFNFQLGPELSEEVLLQDDEEEDEENEDRSWRR